MNSYERYMAVLRGEAADILPRLPILMQFAAEFIGSNYGAFASDHRMLVEANLRCAEHFGFDQVSAISDPFRETQGFGAEIEFVPDGVPRCVKPPLEDDRDLANLAAPDPHSSERMLDRVRAVEAFKQAVAGTYSILGWIEGPAAEAADLRGVTNFLMDSVMEPDYANELMTRCVDVGIEFARAQVEAGADTIGVGDAIASQVSADTYEHMILPHEQRLLQGVRDAGGLVRLHICGNITHLLPYLGSLAVDIVDVDWMVDMAAARAALPDKPLVANLDPVNAVMKSTPEAIQDALRAVYDTVGNPLMAGAGCEIPAGTKPELLQALCEPIPYRA
jgi:MtaA/CmuA family methyltransferase